MSRDEGRTWGAKLARLLRLAEEAVYILIGVLLVFAAIGLLVGAGLHFVSEVRLDAHAATLSLLDTLLLVLMLAEILYTLIVTLVEHVLVLRPFLIIALIAAVRRILILTGGPSLSRIRDGRAFPAYNCRTDTTRWFDPHSRDLSRPPHPSTSSRNTTGNTVSGERLSLHWR